MACLVLLPGGRPRRFGSAAGETPSSSPAAAEATAVASFSHDGGRPLLRPRPLARRSKVKIASSICSRSSLSSASILSTSKIGSSRHHRSGGLNKCALPRNRDIYLDKESLCCFHNIIQCCLGSRVLLVPTIRCKTAELANRWFVALSIPLFPMEIKRNADQHKTQSHQRFSRSQLK